MIWPMKDLLAENIGSRFKFRENDEMEGAT